MKRPLALALAAAAVLAFGAGAPAGQRGAKPALRVLDTTPLVVRGTNFHRRELVRVTYRATGEPVLRKTRAGAAGAFTVRFADINVHACDGGATIVARGSTGTLAFLKLPAPLCPPPLSPSP